MRVKLGRGALDEANSALFLILPGVDEHGIPEENRAARPHGLIVGREAGILHIHPRKAGMSFL
jgi:hypothetical protein